MAARERSGAGPLTLGAMLGRPASTVGKVLRRLGRSRLPREPRPPVVRYERERPGELVHIDTKKLGRFWNVGSASSATGSRAARAPAGSTYTSPSTTTRGWPTPRCSPATAATTRSPSSSGRCASSAKQGVTVEAVMTDNGARVRFARLASPLRRAGATPPADAALHPAHQRQGGTLHPDPAERVGVCPPLRLQRRTPARAPALALSLQGSPTARRYRRGCPHLTPVNNLRGN